MPDIFQVYASVDTSGLNRAMELAGQFSKTAPADAVNITLYQVAREAKQDTPFVTIPTIDQELDTIVGPKLGKRGKPLKNRKAFSGGMATSFRPGVPFAVLIVQARANPGSRYNKLTGGRWARTASPFKGVTRAEGRVAMATAVHKMIANRHRSPHFMQVGWVNVTRKLRPYILAKYIRGGIPDTTVTESRATDLGNAYPAFPGSTSASGMIENDMGGRGKNKASQNEALNTIGAAALQRAIDQAEQFQLAYWKTATDKLAADFAAAQR